MIKTECGAGGAFAADPRSGELLEVTFRLKREADTHENQEASAELLPSINVREADQSLLRDPEKTGSFGRLLLFAFLLLAWIGIVTLLVKWLQTR